MLRRTKKLAGSCNDGPCPAIHETTDTDLIAVQGSRAAEHGMIAVPGAAPSADELAAMGPIPDHETVVLARRTVLGHYAEHGILPPTLTHECAVWVPAGLLADYLAVVRA